MIYDPDAPDGYLDPVSEEEVWERLGDFLTELIPVAEEAGVRLAAHPDDPPLPVLRQTGRMLYHPDRFDRLLSLVPSPSNALELCLGTVAEMQGGDIYQIVDRHSRAGQLGYVHFRNVRGKVPNYEEVFIDEGDVDMIGCCAF
jgi:mannonate dehydratase